MCFICTRTSSHVRFCEFVRISDEELRAAVERMTVLGIRAALAGSKSHA